MAGAAPQNRQMSLTAFLMPGGQHLAAWRHTDSQADAGINFAHYAAMARLAEAGKLDAVFLADFAGSINPDGVEKASRSAHDIAFEPITLLSALAAVTQRIGLVATVSSTFNTPFDLARKFASLDLISGGRAGWNLVTSVNESEALNYGLDEHVRHADRYERATEFVEVVSGLWQSWPEGSSIRDRQTGRFFNPEAVQFLNHRGTHFKVRGPLNVDRSPQGAPVVFQAGASEAGTNLAARSAEAIFTAQQTREEAQSFYRDIKSRAQTLGRARDSIRILPGLFPVVAPTRAQSEDIFASLQDLTDQDTGILLLSQLVGADLSPLDLDQPLPDLPETNGIKSRQRLIVDLAKREHLTNRQLYTRLAGARGHLTLVGSFTDVADQMEGWFLNEAADGFNLMPPILPTSLETIVTGLVPELQRRGLFRTEYAGKTLRDHLGLSRPGPASQN